jgi:hypothetical protein
MSNKYRFFRLLSHYHRSATIGEIYALTAHQFKLAHYRSGGAEKGARLIDSIDLDVIDNPLPEDLKSRQSDTYPDEQVANDEHLARTSEHLVNLKSVM